MEEITGLDITPSDAVFAQDSAFVKRLTDTYNIKMPINILSDNKSREFSSCVSLSGASPSKSGEQAVLAVLVSPLSAGGGSLGASAGWGSSNRGDCDMYLLSDLHGVTARLAVGPGAARHHLLQSIRSSNSSNGSRNGDSFAGTVVLLVKPVTIYDPTSKIAQLYLNSQTQLIQVGKARFFGKCIATTKAGTKCKVMIDLNRGDRCTYHTPVRVNLPLTAAQAEHATLCNQAGLATLFGGAQRQAEQTLKQSFGAENAITSATVSCVVAGVGDSESASVTSTISDAAKVEVSTVADTAITVRPIIPLSRKRVPSAADSLVSSISDV